MGKVELKLQIDAALLDEARAAQVPLEEALEVGVRQALRDRPYPLGLAESAASQFADPGGAEARARAWEEQNAEAIGSYNRFIEANGSFGEDLSTW